MKTHGENVQQRESRVHRYGQGHAAGLLGLKSDGVESGQPTYAMFSKKTTRAVNVSGASGNNELRRRHGQGLEPKYQASSPYPESQQSPQDTADNSKQLHQQRVKHSKSRQESAVQIEKTVAEVFKPHPRLS